MIDRIQTSSEHFMNTEPRWEVWDQDIMVCGIKNSREVEKAKA